MGGVQWRGVGLLRRGHLPPEHDHTVLARINSPNCAYPVNFRVLQHILLKGYPPLPYLPTFFMLLCPPSSPPGPFGSPLAAPLHAHPSKQMDRPLHRGLAL
jgi:hypothetical protein